MPKTVYLIEEVRLVCLLGRTGDLNSQSNCHEAIEQSSAWKRDARRLSNQIQRATGSVMANIAEGFVRRSSKKFVQFLLIAMS